MNTGKKPTEHILVIDNYDSFTYNLIQILEEIPNCIYEVVRNDQIPINHLCEFSKILISPGPGHPSEFQNVKTLLSRIDRTVGVLGICLGHQIIAQAFGGHIEQMAVVSHGMQKTVKIASPCDPLFENLPDQFQVGLYHSWIVTEKQLPDCLRVTARSTDGQIMALSHRELNVRGVQFHPESILTPNGRMLMRNWLKTIDNLEK